MTKKTTCQCALRAALALVLGMGAVPLAACGKHRAASPPPAPTPTRKPADPKAAAQKAITGGRPATGASQKPTGQTPVGTPFLEVPAPLQEPQPTPEEIASAEAQQAQVAKVKAQVDQALQQRIAHDRRISAAFAEQIQAEKAYDNALFAHQAAVADKAAWDVAEADHKRILADATLTHAQKKRFLQALGPHSATPPAVPPEPPLVKMAQIPPLRVDPDAVRQADALMFALKRAVRRDERSNIHEILDRIGALSDQLPSNALQDIKQEIEGLLAPPGRGAARSGEPSGNASDLIKNGSFPQ